MTFPRNFSGGRQLDKAVACRPRSFAQFGVGDAQKIEADGTPTWIARGANFVVTASAVRAGAELVQDVADESMLLLSPAVRVTLETGGATETVEEEALAILPPGEARLRAASDGMVVRVFSSAAEPFTSLASNAGAYRSVNDTAPLNYGPMPPDGFHLRVYRLVDHRHDVGFGRIFRSTNLMINIFEPSSGARDLSRLSPHDHADFEQGSLTLDGDFKHYLRSPWGPDSRLWRNDEFLACSGCSLLVIPPRMLHTTSWSTTGARLIDIFAPPRRDFAQKGWVRNAADYPLEDLAGAE